MEHLNTHLIKHIINAFAPGQILSGVGILESFLSGFVGHNDIKRKSFT